MFLSFVGRDLEGIPQLDPTFQAGNITEWRTPATAAVGVKSTDKEVTELH